MSNTRRALLGVGAGLLALPAFAQTNAPVVQGQGIQSQTNVIDALVGTGRHTRFVEMVSRAGLVDYLRGAGPFTLFAPTDDAIGRVPASLRDQLMSGTDTGAPGRGPQTDLVRLPAFVQMHIVEGRYGLAQLANTTTRLRTRNGNEIEVASAPGQPYMTRIVGDSGFGIGGVNVELRPTQLMVPEIMASNGIILPIDVPLIQ